MAKRNTTGLPRKKRKTEEAAEGDASSGGNIVSQLQNQIDDEAGLQRLLVVGTGVVVAIIALLIGGTLLWEYLFVPQQTVATVNGDSISVAEFQERVRLERTVLNQRLNLDFGFFMDIGQDPNQLIQQDPYNTWWQELTGQPELLGSRVLNEMIDEQIIRTAAEERNVTVDPAAIDEQVEQFFNLNRPEETEEVTDPTETPLPTETPTPFVSPTPSSTPRPTNTPEPTPTPLEDEAAADESGDDLDVTPTVTPRPTNTPVPTQTFEEREEEFRTNLDQFYTQAQRRSNLNEAAVRRYFEYQALLTALQDDVTAEISQETTYVNSRHILVATQEEAENILAALESGESFAALAQAVSTDTGSGSRGGELGWAPASNFVPEFRDAVSEAPIGETVGPIESEFGFHIIQVSAREEREMTEDEYQRAQAVAFQEWFDGTTSEENNDIQRGDNWPRHVPVEPQFVFEPVGQPTEEAPGAN
jgi:hypothetical protein